MIFIDSVSETVIIPNVSFVPQAFNQVNILAANPSGQVDQNTTNNFTGTKLEKLNRIKKKILLIKNCDYKIFRITLIFPLNKMAKFSDNNGF